VFVFDWHFVVAANHGHSLKVSELTNEEMDDEDNTSEEQSDDHASTAVYTITFKCVRTTKEQRYQDVLARAAQEKRNGRDVKVRITPELQNPFDAKAIAFYK